MNEPTRFYVDFRRYGVAVDWWMPHTFPANNLNVVKKAARDSIKNRVAVSGGHWTFAVYQADCHSFAIPENGVSRHWTKGKQIYSSG